jgi:heme O synthase-like polyprenyltransferase
MLHQYAIPILPAAHSTAHNAHNVIRYTPLTLTLTLTLTYLLTTVRAQYHTARSRKLYHSILIWHCLFMPDPLCSGGEGVLRCGGDPGGKSNSSAF